MSIEVSAWIDELAVKTSASKLRHPLPIYKQLQYSLIDTKPIDQLTTRTLTLLVIYAADSQLPIPSGSIKSCAIDHTHCSVLDGPIYQTTCVVWTEQLYAVVHVLHRRRAVYRWCQERRRLTNVGGGDICRMNAESRTKKQRDGMSAGGDVYRTFSVSQNEWMIEWPNEWLVWWIRSRLFGRVTHCIRTNYPLFFRSRAVG